MKDTLRKLAILIRDCWYAQLLVLTAFAGLGYWISERDDPAAWVQAVGSLIGIALAIAIPAWQRNTEANDGKHAERKLFRAIALKIREDIRTLKLELHTRVVEMQTMIDTNTLACTINPHSTIVVGSALGSIFIDINLISSCPECIQLLAVNINEYNGVALNNMKTYNKGQAQRVNAPYEAIIIYLEAALIHCYASEDEVEYVLESD